MTTTIAFTDIPAWLEDSRVREQLTGEPRITLRLLKKIGVLPPRGKTREFVRRVLHYLRRPGEPLYASDRWDREIKQLYHDPLDLGIKVLENDGYACTFECRNKVYHAVWTEGHPFNPPIFYCSSGGIPFFTNDNYSPALSLLTILTHQLYH
jgi:hypothetical protein